MYIRQWLMLEGVYWEKDGHPKGQRSLGRANTNGPVNGQAFTPGCFARHSFHHWMARMPLSSATIQSWG